MIHKKDSGISKRFITVIAIIYSLLILLTALSFNYIIKENSITLKNILLENNNELFLEKIETVIERLYLKKADNLWKVKHTLKKYCTGENDFLYVIVFSKTPDENYFRIIDKIPLHNNMRININKHDVVQEKKETNYLKKGLVHGIVEQKIYSDNNLSWQNIYYPYTIKNDKYILQFMVSAFRTGQAMDNFHESIIKIRWFMIIITIILITAVFILTLLFTHNFSLLIKNLSSYMKKASQGELEINLRTTSDKELNELANSFNSLIDELKDKTKDEPVSRLFDLGVSKLKENKLDDSIALFKSLTILKPEGFGSHFNLGVAYAKKKDYENSLKMFEIAYLANPANKLTQSYIEKVKKLYDSTNE